MKTSIRTVDAIAGAELLSFYYTRVSVFKFAKAANRVVMCSHGNEDYWYGRSQRMPQQLQERRRIVDERVLEGGQ
jgi:hypothetical protein